MDAIVIGAGAFGLSVAFALGRVGLRPLVLDRAGPGAGASGGPVGALAPHPPDAWSAKKALQRDALLGAEDWWRAIAEAGGGEPGYRRLGRLIPLRTEAERERAKRREVAAAAHWPAGLGWHVIEPGAALRWIAPEACPAGAVREDLTALLQPRRAIDALVRAVLEGGGSVRSGAEVVAVSPGAVRLRDGERLQADLVVVAAGIGSAPLLAPALGSEALRGVKGQAASLRARVPEDTPVLADEGLWLVPHADGTLALGSASEERWRTKEPDEALDALLARARRLWPWLAGAALLERWAGIRPRAVGPEPLVGWLGPGLLVATAGFKTGWALAPVVAEIMARMATGESVVLPAGLAAPRICAGGATSRRRG